MPTRLPPRLQPWFPLCLPMEQKHGVDPLLLLAIIDRESLGGQMLIPKGPGGLGDNGQGHGLCQIDKRYHAAFCLERLEDGSMAWANPERNIDYGASILAGHLRLYEKDPDPEVWAVAAYNASLKRVGDIRMLLSEPATHEKRVKAADLVTTHRNYVSDVLGRRDRWRRLMSIPLTPHQ